MPRIETQRLIMRPFVAADWRARQALDINKMSLKRDLHDHDLPTSDRDCQHMASFLASRDDQFLVVCLKIDGRLIGFLAYNGIQDDGQLDLGHVIHTEFQDAGHDTEALQAAVQHAFASVEVRPIVTRNAPDWGEQLAPLKALGLRPLEGGAGEMVISREAWEATESVWIRYSQVCRPLPPATSPCA